jgi:hypothetical protein
MKFQINCSVFGVCIYHTHANIRKQVSFLYTRGIKQIIEDDGTLILARRQCGAMLTVPSSLAESSLCVAQNSN